MSDLIEKLDAWARTPRVKMSGVQHKDAGDLLGLLRPLVRSAEQLEICLRNHRDEIGWCNAEILALELALYDLRVELLEYANGK